MSKKRVFAIGLDDGEPIGVVGEIGNALEVLRSYLEDEDMFPAGGNPLVFTIFPLKMSEAEIDKLPEY